MAKSGEDILTNTTSEKYSPEDNYLNVFTVFVTFSSNNRRKRALRDLAEINQVTAMSPWNDAVITFTADDEPRARSVCAPAALVLNPVINGFRLAKVLMDSDSGLNLIYKDTQTRAASSKAVQPFEALSPVEKRDVRGKLYLMWYSACRRTTCSKS